MRSRRSFVVYYGSISKSVRPPPRASRYPVPHGVKRLGVASGRRSCLAVASRGAATSTTQEARAAHGPSAVAHTGGEDLGGWRPAGQPRGVIRRGAGHLVRPMYPRRSHRPGDRRGTASGQVRVGTEAWSNHGVLRNSSSAMRERACRRALRLSFVHSASRALGNVGYTPSPRCRDTAPGS
jgi:hypothetical protein